jgi:hypothetical protein
MDRTYISTADTAKLIRASLKEAFPGVKFSVRSDVYSGGSSIRIAYTDGPTGAQVDAVVQRFSGAYFDGSIDYKGSVYAMMDGKAVKFCADFIFVNRSLSDNVLAGVLRRVGNKFGVDGLTVEAYRTGNLYSITTQNGFPMDREVNIAVSRHTCCVTQPSKTAGRVFITHDDGYSMQCGSGHSAVNVER